MFQDMLGRVKSRVSELIFVARLSPQAALQQQAQAAMMARQRAAMAAAKAAPAPAGATATGGITGPGLPEGTP